MQAPGAAREIGWLETSEGAREGKVSTVAIDQPKGSSGGCREGC